MKQETQAQELLNTRQHNQELRNLIGRRDQDRREADRSQSQYLDSNYSDHTVYPSFAIPKNEPLSSNSDGSSVSYDVFDTEGNYFKSYHKNKSISSDDKSVSSDSLETLYTSKLPYFTAPKTYSNILEGEPHATKKLNEIQARNLKGDLEEEVVEAPIKEPIKPGKKKREIEYLELKNNAET